MFLKIPLQKNGDRFATVTGTTAVVQATKLLVETQLGERPDAPGFGIMQPTGKTVVTVPALYATATRFCPEAETLTITTTKGGYDVAT